MKSKKKKRAKKHFAGVDPDLEDILDRSVRESFTKIFRACYKAVEDVEIQEEG